MIPRDPPGSLVFLRDRLPRADPPAIRPAMRCSAQFQMPAPRAGIHSSAEIVRLQRSDRALLLR